MPTSLRRRFHVLSPAGSLSVGLLALLSSIGCSGAAPGDAATSPAANDQATAAPPAASGPSAEEPRLFATQPEIPAPAVVPAPGHVHHVMDATSDSALPQEWQDIASLASTAAGMFSGASSAIGIAQSILTATGFLHTQESATDQKLDAIEKKLDKIYTATVQGANMTRNDFISTQLGMAEGARDGAAQQVVDGTPVVVGSRYEGDSRDAVTVLKQDGYWFRPADDGIYSDYMFQVIPDRPSGSDTGSAGVWDYRTIAPALLKVIQTRLDVLGMMDPSFARNGHYATELHATKMYLKALRDHMWRGVRCGSQYKLFPADGEQWDPPVGTADQWHYYAGCVDIYSGATSYRYLSWLDKNQPDSDGTWARTAAPADIRNAQLDLRVRMGIPGIERMIGILGWYENAWRPVYTGFGAIAHTGSYDGVSVVAPNQAPAALWSYDADLGLLRNGEGRCLHHGASFTDAVATCDWNDANYAWWFTGPQQPRLHNSATNQCLDTPTAGSTASPTVQPCDARVTEAVSFKSLFRNSDILWRNDAGQVAVWHMAQGTGALANAAYPAAPDKNWQVQGTGDFDGDGIGDVLWRYAPTGAVSIWFMKPDGTIRTQTYPGTPDASWKVQGTGDFDGDGQSDILWRNTSGAVSIWFSGATTRETYPGTPDNSWQVQGTGDFDGDGQSDILWRNTSGAVSIWFSGATARASYPGTPDASWKVQGTRDFDGDGQSDILWRNTSGALSIWFSGATQRESYPGTADSSWMIQGTGDFDGDGQSDILWRNTSGVVAIWFSANNQRAGYPGTPDNTWHVQGTLRDYL